MNLALADKETIGRLFAAYLYQPQEVSIETLALCNAAYSFCPYPTLERKGERMSDELLERLITEMEDFELPFYFSPFKVNEPLLDKRLIPLCKEMNERVPQAKLRIFTNGAALTKKKIEQIAELDIDHLWVSLNSHDPDEYEELMRMPFDRTAKRLDVLHSMDFPHHVILSTVGFPNEPFRRYCFDRWPNFESLAIKKDGWLGYVEPQSEEIPDKPCSRWWELSIMANGVVSLCCMDGTGQFAIGDLNENTMLEVYNSPEWRERREKVMSRRGVYPCSTCTY